MTKREVKNKVFTVLSELSGVEKISKNHKLQDDLGLDSLGLVKMLLTLEEIFGVILSETDMNPFVLITVNDVVILMERYNEQ